jgi:Dyp-type peroxidase family
VTLETADIQGILLSAYGKLPHARFLLLAFDDAPSPRDWLGRIAAEIRSAKQRAATTDVAVQVAFAFAGLERLGLSWQALKGFSREFREGMAGSARRARKLGDIGANSSDNWQWGGPNTPVVHAILMLFAPTGGELERLCSAHGALLAEFGIRILRTLDSPALPNYKEHFGFRDGVSQPKIEGVSSNAARHETVKAGEFVLGYPNERREYTARPLLDPIEDKGGVLPRAEDDGSLRDLGRNGSYLVLRQLRQDVASFWSWTRTAAAGGSSEERVRIGAKMIGRWPGGAPLATHATNPGGDSTDNDFLYHERDRHGLGCPVGAHIRRANPRDSRPPKPGTDESLQINRRHRLLRRGRPFGPPLTPALDTASLLDAADDGCERGLYFACLNADISRQFEFVQQTWVHNSNFDGLMGETDPLIGIRGPDSSNFTIPEEPVRKRYRGLPEFVRVQGGAYFFLPGIRALHYLAGSPPPLASRYAAPDLPASLLADTWYTRLARSSNSLIERLLALARRFTTLRAVFDAVLQGPLTDAVQWLLRRRRQRLRIDADLALAEERELPGEADVAQRITEQMTAFLYEHYRNGLAERAGNTKTYGLLEAAFEVHDVAADLKVGLFAEPKTYRAWVRFGGPGPLVVPDIKDHGVLSIGVKLLGVEGAKLLEDETDTLDFSGISAPTFTTPDVIENLKLQRYVGAGMAAWYFLNPFDSHYLDMILQGLHAKAHGSPFETSYYSCVPYLYGAGRACKFRFRPQFAGRSRVPFPAPDNYLRQAMRNTLERHDEVRFDFTVQFQEDPVLMPIEDASIIWRSPETTVATLRIARQQFDTPERDRMARELTVNPWHTIAEHRPLGNQNRARRTIYYETARVRQRINREQHRVPR